VDLTQLIDAYRGPLIGLIASWGAPWGDAVELAEESFAEAWLQRESCRGDWRQADGFGRWLRGVARNQYRNWARSRRRCGSRVVNLESTTLDELSGVDGEAEADSEDLQALRQAIDRLPTLQRQVVWMHYLEESSVREVATLLSVTEKTVEGRLYQARRTLRRLLEGKLDRKAIAPQIARILLCLLS
jgi:RNA polymerase sigma-70 factor, ECF subfamily